MNEERNEALVAAGGLATGSILGGILGKKKALKDFDKKVTKTQGRRDVSAAKHILKANEKYKTTGDAPAFSRALGKLEESGKRGGLKIENLRKKAGKLGRSRGAWIGAGTGLLAGLGGYEYLKNKNRDGYN